MEENRMKYTEKRNGINVIPLKNVVCGVDMPRWKLIKVSDNEMYLVGDAVDKLASFEEVGEVVHAYWIEKQDDNENNPFLRRKWYCSFCSDWQTYGETSYCPNCGAKMDLDKSKE